MSRRRRALGAVALALAAGAGALGGCHRAHRLSSGELRREIAALEQEREALNARLDDMLARDPRLVGMPEAPVRVGIPTTLARTLLEKLAVEFVNRVTLVLEDIHVEHQGEVKKVVTLGSYALEVTIETVSGRLQAEPPAIDFGRDSVAVRLPVRIASGQGRARLHFRWDGKGVAGAACGDLDVVQPVTGQVKPAGYLLRGTLMLAASGGQILATPRFPPLRVRLRIEPSAGSWAATRAILDSKRSGVCGTVLDHVDVLARVKGIVDKGFEVRLPTEKIRPLVVPVVVPPTVDLGGRPVALGISVGGLTVTEQALWLGVDVRLLPPGTTPAPPEVTAAGPPAAVRGREHPPGGRRPGPAR